MTESAGVSSSVCSTGGVNQAGSAGTGAGGAGAGNSTSSSRRRSAREAALDALERAMDLGWRGPWAGPWLDHDPDFHALRDSRRFTRMSAQVRLAD